MAMIADKEQCGMMDYLFSLSFVREDTEKEGNYPFIDETEERIVNDYKEQLKKKRKQIERYCFKEYNLLFELYLYQTDQQEFYTLEEFCNQLEAMDDTQWKEAVFSVLQLEQEREEFEAIDELSVSEEQKWNLFSMIRNREKSLYEIEQLLKELYPMFLYYEDQLMELGKEREEEIRGNIEKDVEAYYADVLDNVVDFDKSDIEQSKHYILFMSRFAVIISDMTKKKRFMSGIHVQEVKRYKRENQVLGEEEKERVLKALSDPSRFMILKMLKEGKLSNKEMAKELNITPAGISYQLNQLVSVKLVRYCTKESGRGKKYVVNGEYLKKVFQLLLEELI